MKKIFLTFFILFFSFAFSQTHAIDSLTALLKTDKEDTNKVNHLTALGREFIDAGKYDSAFFFINNALQLASSLSVKTENSGNFSGWAKGMSVCYRYIGIIYFYKADYPKTLEFYNKSLKIDVALGNKTGISRNLVNIGNIYYYQGNYYQALECYFKALKINEELGNKNGVASNYNAIGLAYNDQGDYPKALEFYFKAFKINEELGNKNGVALNLGNIGNVYYNQFDYHRARENHIKALKINEELADKSGIALNLNNIGIIYKKEANYPKALEYYFKALKINEELADKKGIAMNLNNIGGVYQVQNEYSIALEYFFKALNLNQELGSKKSSAINLGNIGEIYIMEKRYKEAENFLNEALGTSNEIGAMELVMDHNKFLSVLYSQTNRYQLAYEHYKLYTAAKDSLFNEDKSKEIGRLEMRHEIEIAEMERERKAAEELKKKTQKTERRNLLEYSGIFIGLLLVGLLITVLGFVKVKPWMAEGITFFAFLLFFEFILVLLDPYMEKFTKGEPAYKLLINAAVAACIFPLNAFFEKVLKKRLMKK